MRYTFLVIIVICLLSCAEKKVVELPEIDHSDITDIQDVSAAYLFYNETQPDSVELNRKNLISTTNWLINIDKRLTLKQVIPHIKFLQNKKANGAHKNENAKNYFTCHDTSRNNLGFIEFTNVVYDVDFENIPKPNFSSARYFGVIKLNPLKKIELEIASEGHVVIEHYKSFDDLFTEINALTGSGKLNLVFACNSESTFQDYITFKSLLSKVKNDSLYILNNEFIY